jgi:hypothetical protein
MSVDPYQPPKSKLDDAGATGTAPPLWNPNAAANWSLLFTPILGAWLHMLNWRALGEPEKAAGAKTWLVISFLMIPVYFALGFVLDEATSDSSARLLQLSYLFVWYFGSARAQARNVKEKFGKDYPRRRWGKPLGLAVLGLVGFFAAIFVIAILLGNLLRQ